MLNLLYRSGIVWTVSAKTVAELTDIAAGIGRTVRERTTTYGVPTRP